MRIHPQKEEDLKDCFTYWQKHFYIFVFLVITYSIFQLPYVQNYLKNKIIQTVEEKPAVKLRLIISLSIYGMESLLKILISNMKDCLVCCLLRNWDCHCEKYFSLYNNQLDISTLRIDGVSFHILTKYNETESNLSRFFKVFQSKSEGGKTTQFLLMIKQVFFRNISIVIENENKGVKKEISLKSGLIELDKLDLECREFWVNQIYFNGPSYKMDIMSEACFPDETLSIEQKEESDVNKDWFPFHSGFRIWRWKMGFLVFLIIRFQ